MPAPSTNPFIRLLDVLFFTRPLLLIPTWTIFLLYRKSLAPNDGFTLHTALNLIGLTLITASAYILNQIADRDSDRANNKLGFFDPPVSFTLKFALILFTVCTLLPLGYALFARPGLLLAYLLAIGFGIAYSIPPISAKDRPFWGFFFNAFAFSFIILETANGGTIQAHLLIPALEFSEMESLIRLMDSLITPILYATTMFFAVGAVYLLTTIPDIDGDKRIGKRTLAIAIGAKPTALLALMCSILALVTAGIVGFSWALIPIALSIPSFGFAAFSSNPTAVRIGAKLPILWLTIAAIIAFPFYGLFTLALIALCRAYYKYRFGRIYPEWN